MRDILIVMAHHAYFVEGESDKSVSAALEYAEQHLGLHGADNPDVVVLRFGLLSIDDARRLIGTANTSATSGKKAIIASMTRIFHEAQNSLLKVLEEPPEGVTIILCVPSAGMFIPTLQSRLLPLPLSHLESNSEKIGIVPDENLSAQFLGANDDEREKIVSKLVDRAKSDKDDVKQEARREAIELLGGIMKDAHVQFERSDDEKSREAARRILEETSSFMPILYERSAPLKQMFEHLLLVIPKKG